VCDTLRRSLPLLDAVHREDATNARADHVREAPQRIGDFGHADNLVRGHEASCLRVERTDVLPNRVTTRRRLRQLVRLRQHVAVTAPRLDFRLCVAAPSRVASRERSSRVGRAWRSPLFAHMRFYAR
jgi:hypothetical protein